MSDNPLLLYSFKKVTSLLSCLISTVFDFLAVQSLSALNLFDVSVSVALWSKKIPKIYNFPRGGFLSISILTPWNLQGKMPSQHPHCLTP